MVNAFGYCFFSSQTGISFNLQIDVEGMEGGGECLASRDSRGFLCGGVYLALRCSFSLFLNEFERRCSGGVRGKKMTLSEGKTRE